MTEYDRTDWESSVCIGFLTERPMKNKNVYGLYDFVFQIVRVRLEIIWVFEIFVFLPFVVPCTFSEMHNVEDILKQNSGKKKSTTTTIAQTM